MKFNKISEGKPKSWFCPIHSDVFLIKTEKHGTAYCRFCLFRRVHKDRILRAIQSVMKVPR